MSGSDPLVDAARRARQPAVAAFSGFKVGAALETVDGQIIVFFVMTVAAAEAAVGLALVISLFRHRETLSPDAFTSLKW